MTVIADSVKTAADDIRSAAEAGYARHRSNGNLGTTGIARAVASVYLDAKSKMDALQQSATTGAAANLASLMTKVFGIDDIAGGNSVDRAAASMSYRDASERAQQLDTPEAAQALLDRANTTGDELQARAIAQFAWSMGGFGAWADVLNAYAATRPKAADALGKLYELNGTQMFATDLFAFILVKPYELANYSDYQIAGIVNGDGASA